ncbi:DUF768 domain-containing protein [Mesorhizobium huakuii]|uniref:DUF768 domain-containing protein n=1 Tax=Mesorhizobium huakuii TaxID=28104 RepID=A0A7G6T1K8_9HYPH|nr:DUF768 domain-containing protein [Mesorhizobium huakuii]
MITDLADRAIEDALVEGISSREIDEEVHSLFVLMVEAVANQKIGGSRPNVLTCPNHEVVVHGATFIWSLSLRSCLTCQPPPRHACPWAGAGPWSSRRLSDAPSRH